MLKGFECQRWKKEGKAFCKIYETRRRISSLTTERAINPFACHYPELKRLGLIPERCYNEVQMW